MFKQLLRFEIFYQLKQRAFPLFSFLFLFFGFFVGRQGFAPNNVNFNANYQVFLHSSLFSLGCVFIVMFFAISGVLRDRQYHMEPLINSSSIKKHQYFFSRFLGVFLFSLLAFSPFLIGYGIGVSFSGLDAERLAPFKFETYVLPWLYNVLPNLFICSSIIFSISALTKSSAATYVSAVFVYMLYFICSLFLNSPLLAQSVPASPESMRLAALADPFGISAFFEQTQYWTPFQKNEETLSFSGLFLFNRILWVAFGLIILGVSYKLFSFRKIIESSKKAPNLNSNAQEKLVYSPKQPSRSIRAQIYAFCSLIKIELAGVFKSLPFIAIMLMWIFIVFSEFYSTLMNGGEYQTSSYPLTSILIELLASPLSIFGLLLIVFYSAELVWRERSYNYHMIIDATPQSNLVFFLAKLLSLLLLPVIMISLGIVMAIGFQLAFGYYNFEFSLYGTVFYYFGFQFVIFSMTALFIHSFSKNKYVGLGIFGLFVLLSLKSEALGLLHPLWSIGNMPGVFYSNMYGFSDTSLLFNHLALYWISFGVLLTLVSYKAWQRGSLASVKHQLNQLMINCKTSHRILSTVPVVLLVFSGVRVYYNNNILNNYQTLEDQLDLSEQYERKYKDYETLEKLYITDIKTEVAIFPYKEKYTIKGRYILTNKGTEPISKMLFTESVQIQSMSLEGANLIEHDSVLGVRVFKFKKAIKPKESVRFWFELIKEKNGYESDRAIVKNGSYITHRNFEPFLGYRNSKEISNNFERKKRGLLPKELVSDMAADIVLTNTKVAKVTYETLVSTSEDQIALASGDLIKSWKEDGRNYYQYKASTEVVPMLAYFSANYEQKKSSFKDIQIEQYFESKHPFNIATIERSLKEALAYCTENFGAYPFQHIRLAEIPNHWAFGGYAHPGLISMVEDRLYLTDVSDPKDFNLVAKRTIHEVAHQWWGHILSPKLVAGGSLLVEGFAQYTEGVVLEKMYGKAILYSLSERARSRYFSGRAFANKSEPPVYLVTDEGFISYGKAYTVLNGLKDLIGEQQVNDVLKTLVDKHRKTNKLEANTLEFLDELYKVSSKEEQLLINDWFKRVITYDLAIETASYTALNNGSYEIKVQIKASRLETLNSGAVKEISINEPIKIGVFTKHPSQMQTDKELIYYQSKQISKALTEITIVVSQLPNYIAIDPFGTRTDENLVDNVFRLKSNSVNSDQ